MRDPGVEWGFLICYPWEEAQELLDEEEVAYGCA